MVLPLPRSSIRAFPSRGRRRLPLQCVCVRRTTLLLVLLCGASFLAGLGRPAIGDSDEAFYAEAAREMLASGDWLTPHYNFEPRFQKPILSYWLIAAGYAVVGVGDAAARVWSALAGLALALLTAACGRRWYDERTGFWAGCIVATAFGYFSVARSALPDLPLAFFVTLATWAAIVGTLDRPPRPLGWAVVAGLAAGLGLLTKGPIAVVLPALVLAPLWVVERRTSSLTLGWVASASVTAAVVAVPWYAAMTHVHGLAYLEGFLLGDNVERFATTLYNEHRPPWFYLPIVAGGLLPWTLLSATFVPALVRWWRAGRGLDVLTTRVVLWAGLPLLFFSLSVGKQPRYVLPILPPLALLVAVALARRIRDGRAPDRGLAVAAACTGALVLALAVLLWRALPLVVGVQPHLVMAGVFAIGVAALLIAVVPFVVEARGVPLVVACGGALTLLGLQYGLSPAGRDPVQDMAALVVSERRAAEGVATFRVFVRNLVFYTRIRQDDLSTDEEVRAYLAGPERVLCVIPEDELARLRADAPLPARVLGAVPYLDASAVKLRTLFSPDPARDLERVLLVTNR
jgi:4-amino-4-deoxy-L-arabinose transferase-like glycosyltransferase